ERLRLEVEVGGVIRHGGERCALTVRGALVGTRHGICPVHRPPTYATRSGRSVLDQRCAHPSSLPPAAAGAVRTGRSGPVHAPVQRTRPGGCSLGCSLDIGDLADTAGPPDLLTPAKNVRTTWPWFVASHDRC